MQFLRTHLNYIITIGVEFIIVLASFLVYRIANENLTDIGFSEYNLARRSISFLQPILMIGLGVAVPRYISIYKMRNSIFRVSLFLLFLAAVLLGSILISFRSFFSELFFGSNGYQNYIFPLFLMLFGYCYHGIVFGFLRGKQSKYLSNLLQLLNIGLVPLIVIYNSNTVLKVLYLNSITLLIILTLSTFILIVKFPANLSKKRVIVDSKTLLRYGLPRILGDFSLLLLLTAPSYIVLHITDNIEAGGDVAYSLSLLNIFGAAFGPLGLVLLPELSHFIALKDQKKINNRFLFFLVISIITALLGYFIFYSFSNEILSLLLGKGFKESIEVTSIITLQASLGFSVYVVLRNFLDAIRVRATNSFNLIVSFIIYSVLASVAYTFNMELEAFLYSFVVSMSILGLLTFIQCIKALKEV